MKKILLIAAVFMSGITAMAQQKPDDVIKVNTEKYNFGKIKQNVPVTTYFEITNISKQPVVVETTWGSCGCTTPEKPKEPIAPGRTAKIKVDYNAAAMSTFEKDVYIKLAGVTETKVVKITGEVLDAAAYNTYVKSDEYKKAKAAETSKQSKTVKSTKSTK
ncbi:MAG TPA: DUF1573 domain-containing protein [Chitinophagaceae bacterium]|jgi:hypothetical protein|nr:DUF1573 domain-containing protein [Chitinophagaceae bacterium]